MSNFSTMVIFACAPQTCAAASVPAAMTSADEREVDMITGARRALAMQMLIVRCSFQLHGRSDIHGDLARDEVVSNDHSAARTQQSCSSVITVRANFSRSLIARSIGGLAVYKASRLPVWVARGFSVGSAWQEQGGLALARRQPGPDDRRLS